MLFAGVPVYRAGGLRTAITLGLVEITGGDGALAKNALERDTAVHGFGCVTSHSSL
jgi:hypothetical protein